MIMIIIIYFMYSSNSIIQSIVLWRVTRVVVKETVAYIKDKYFIILICNYY